MTHQQLQNAILDCTPPGLWKQAVKEMSHVFTEKELMMIAYQQTATFESRMKAMDLLGKYRKGSHEDCISADRYLFQPPESY